MEKCQALICSGPDLLYSPDCKSCYALVALALAFSCLPCIVHAKIYGHMGTGNASHRILEVAGHCEAPHGLQCVPGLKAALHHSLQHEGFTSPETPSHSGCSCKQDAQLDLARFAHRPDASPEA